MPSLKELAANGILRAWESAGKTLFSSKELMHTEVLAKCVHVKDTAATALRALVHAVRAEKRLDRIERLLGVDTTYLPTDIASIKDFTRRCYDTVAEPTELLEAEEVLTWAYELANVTEEYLHLVEKLVGEKEPWVPFMLAAQNLYERAPRERFCMRKDLEASYAYVRAARRHLRQVAYFFVQARYGNKTASRAFPECGMDQRDEEIINLLFSAPLRN